MSYPGNNHYSYPGQQGSGYNQQQQGGGYNQQPQGGYGGYGGPPPPPPGGFQNYPPGPPPPFGGPPPGFQGAYGGQYDGGYGNYGGPQGGGYGGSPQGGHGGGYGNNYNDHQQSGGYNSGYQGGNGDMGYSNGGNYNSQSVLPSVGHVSQEPTASYRGNYASPQHMNRPPSGTQQFGSGAPSGYGFQYSNCSGRRKALLVGINYIGTKNQLKGCINDANNIRRFLMRMIVCCFSIMGYVADL